MTLSNLRNKLNIAAFIRHKRSAQSSVIFGSMIASMGLNFLSSVITARALGPEQFGDVKFIQVVWMLINLSMSFGFYYSGSRVLLLEQETDKIREMVGANLVIVLSIGFAMAGLIILLAFPIDALFNTHIAILLIILSPLMVSLPLHDSLYWILQSLNRIVLLSILNIFPIGVYLVSILLISNVSRVTTSFVLIAQQLCQIIVYALIIFSLRPKFSRLKENIRKIFHENKAYGWPVYVGSLGGGALAQINSLAIAYWVDNTTLGYYSLALRVVEPLKMLPGSVAVANLRDFARQRRIPRQIVLATIGVTLFSLFLALWLFGAPLSWIYSENFAAVGPMARLAVFGAILAGFGDFYNRFLGAHGKGYALRNSALLTGVVNLAGFFLLVPAWGAWGGIITTVLAGIVYLGFMLWHYQNHSSE